MVFSHKVSVDNYCVNYFIFSDSVSNGDTHTSVEVDFGDVMGVYSEFFIQSAVFGCRMWQWCNSGECLSGS